LIPGAVPWPDPNRIDLVAGLQEAQLRYLAVSVDLQRSVTQEPR
jgi:hypothetical protein